MRIDVVFFLLTADSKMISEHIRILCCGDSKCGNEWQSVRIAGSSTEGKSTSELQERYKKGSNGGIKNLIK